MLKQGYTLAEVLVVIVIIGVLASLSIPRLTVAIERTRAAEGIHILEALLQAQKMYYADHGKYSNSYTDLDVEIPPSKNFSDISSESVSEHNPLVTVTRNDGSYSLTIDENGTIGCLNNTADDICTKIGH